MGYSIMTPFATESDKQQMQEFMEKNYRPFSTLIKQTQVEELGELPESPPPHDELDPEIENSDFVLGFNYGAGTISEERDYYFSLCYWMSIHAGIRKPFEAHRDMPYVIYDGYEEWALFINKERDETIECMELTEDGYRQMLDLERYLDHPLREKKPMIRKIIKELQRIDEVIHTELKRLSQEWKKQVKN